MATTKAAHERTHTMQNAPAMHAQFLMAFDAFSMRECTIERKKKAHELNTTAERSQLSEYIKVSICGGITIGTCKKSATYNNRDQ